LQPYGCVTRTCATLLLVLGATLLPACGRPRTDIVAITTEDVGPFDMQAQMTDSGLAGHVCLEEPRSSGEVVARIVQQLANHNYPAITLDVYSPQRPVARYLWTRSGQRQDPLGSSANPCSAGR
jgi:hypothetical protein